MEQKIGFPPPLLGESPIRLPILCQAGGLSFLNKPPGIVAARSPREPRDENIETALRIQIDRQKPELCRLGFTSGRVLFPLPTECSGVLPVIHDADQVEFWTNAYGSGQLALHFFIIALHSDLPDEQVCELPIATHFETGGALISHRTGKKSHTRFERIERHHRFDFWNATIMFLRLDQIRLHAFEVGLAIPGENIYLPPGATNPVPAPSLADLQRRLRKPTRAAREPIHPFPHIHLESLILPDGNFINAPLPGSLQQVRDRIRATSYIPPCN